MTKNIVNVFSNCSKNNTIVIARLQRCPEEEQWWLHATSSVTKSQQAAKFTRSQRRSFCWDLNVGQTCFPGNYSSLKQPGGYPHAFSVVLKCCSLVRTSQCLFYLASYKCVRNEVHAPKARTPRDNRRRRWEGEQRQEKWSHLSKVTEVRGKCRNKGQTASALTLGLPCARILFVLKMQMKKGKVLPFWSFGLFMQNTCNQLT